MSGELAPVMIRVAAGMDGVAYVDLCAVTRGVLALDPESIPGFADDCAAAVRDAILRELPAANPA